MQVRHWLGPKLLVQHIDQFIAGTAPGGKAGLLTFLYWFKVDLAHVVDALEATGRGGRADVDWFVSQNPEFTEWASKGTQ